MESVHLAFPETYTRVLNVELLARQWLFPWQPPLYHDIPNKVLEIYLVTAVHLLLSQEKEELKHIDRAVKIL